MFLGRHRTLPFVLILLYTLILFSHNARAQTQQVLILHSYNQGYAWTDNIMAGMNQVFAPVSGQVERHVEYMDTKRFPPEISFEILDAYFSKKYKGIRFDVLLVSDNNALNFAVSRRSRLFPGVPMVFCGINDFSVSMLGREPEITGILEEIDVTGTIRFARQLFPGIRQFYVVNDPTPTGRTNSKRMTRAANALRGEALSFVPLENLTADELSVKLAGLPRDAGILLFTFHKDREEQWLSTDDFLGLIRDHAKVPVFSFWDHYLGGGIVGGRMVSGREQGIKCAEYAMAILKGKSAADIPILVKSPNISLLDYRQLKRFKADSGNIPKDTRILFRPESFLHKYRTPLTATAFALVLLTAAGIVLVLRSTTRKMAADALKHRKSHDRHLSFRHRTTKILSDNEEKYRRIFENSVVGFFQSTPDGKFTNVNPAFAKMIGYESPRELLASVSDIATQFYAQPEDRDTYRRILAEHGRVDGMEFRVKCKDGRRIWVANSTLAYFDPEGRVTHYEGVVTEITKRKLAEEALEKRIVALTRPLDNGSPPITFEELFNLKEIQELQDKFAQATGVASVITDPQGDPITRPCNFSKLCSLIAPKKEEGTAACLHLWQEADMPDGPAIQTCSRSGLWRAGAGIRIQGTHIATWLIGQVRDGTRTEAQMKAYAREIGCEPDQFIAAFKEIPAIPPEQFEQLAQSLYTLTSLLSNTAFQNLQQARLITALQQSEKEQKNLQSQLLQAQKMESVGRLAGGVAHDFNNMLSIITGNADLILNDLEPAHPFRESLVEITRAAQRSADLTRQLLAFARKQAISPRTVNLNDTLEGMFQMLRRLIGEDILLTWHPCPDLWSVRMDPSQVDQILANLCVNARDAIEGTGTITIQTDNCSFDEAFCRTHKGFRPGQFVQLTIRDNGTGMDPHTLDNLFDPFFTTKQLGQGTGLGLATVYGIVTQNNGLIFVDSAPGQGATFTIYFPRYALKAPRTDTPAASSPARGGRETLLVVEDEAAILKVTTRLLEQLGYRVLPTTSPQEALEISRTHPKGEIRLLLTDVIMPEMNGRDLALGIVREVPDMKCLFMSGYTKDVLAPHGVLDPGLNFIAKPFTQESLAIKLREVLDGAVT